MNYTSDSCSQDEPIGPVSYELLKHTQSGPMKILPSNLCIKQISSKEKDPKEKSLVEMGFKANEIVDWEVIEQPQKDNLYMLLKNMVNNHIKPNIRIDIGKTSFNCHMIVLQCYSDLFMELSNEILIQLPEEKISPGAFIMIYDWMLADEPLVQREGILELFNAATFLRIKDLVAQCWLCLDDDVRLREHSAFMLYLEARQFNQENIKQIMLTRICKFFLTLVASKDFLELGAMEICALLSSNTIGVNSETEVFMSAVRWLNYNWEERKSHTIKVLQCVRFNLMPPWYLVTLSKQTDCEEVDRVAGHPDVKRMIHDGISYTTTQLFYGENHEEFQNFLRRYQLLIPIQRQWVFDKECSYHHRLDCPNMQLITYKLFVAYLRMIQTADKDYWQSLEMAKSDKSLVKPCCVCEADFNTTSTESSTQFVRKISRDCGVQVERDDRGSDRRSQEKQTQLPRPIGSVGSGRVQKPVKFKRNKNMCLLETRKLNRPPPFYNSEAPKSCGLQPQLRESNAKDNANCTIETKTSIMDKEKVRKKQQHSDVAVGNSDDGNDDNQLRHNDDKGITEMPAKEVTLQLKCIGDDEWLNNSGTKILVFGGVDPYCLHCMQSQATLKTSLLGSAQQQQHKGYGGINSFEECAGDGNGAGVAKGCTNGRGDQVLFYDSHAAQWQQLSRIPFGSRHHHVAVLCHGLIYIVGGTRTSLGCTKNSIFQRSVWSFDPRTLKWAIECTLPEPRRDFAVVAIDENCERCPLTSRRKTGSNGGLGTGLLIIGGEGDDGTPLDTVWFYDVIRKEWSRKASLNAGRYGFATTIINSEIWIAGGIVSPTSTATADIITDSLEYYSLRCLSADSIVNDLDIDCTSLCGFCDLAAEGGGRWVRSKLRLRIPRVYGKFCRLSSSELYLVGGIGFNLDDRIGDENVLTSLDAVDRFDFTTAKWIACGNIKMARHGHDVVAYNDDQFVIIGGVSTIRKCSLTFVELFDARTQCVVDELPALPWPLSGSSVVVLD